LRLLRYQRLVLRLERVGYVLEEDETEHDVLVLSRVHVIAQSIGGGPELGHKAKVSRRDLWPNNGVGPITCFAAWHIPSWVDGGYRIRLTQRTNRGVTPLDETVDPIRL